MSARVWSAPALGASLAALPSPRASTAGESALAAAAWLLSGEESRFSTRRSFAPRVVFLGGASRLLGVWLARTAGVGPTPAKIRRHAGVAQSSLVRSARPALLR